jgi:hypothetical protein
VSSKQIGDELTNGRKPEDEDNKESSSKSSPTTSGKRSDSESGEEKINQTAQAFDASRMWPLTCFEFSISVDQEDKFLTAQKR